MTSTPTTQNAPIAPDAPTRPDVKTLYLFIEGNEVTLTGTEKGNPTHQALTPRPWVWSRRAAGYVLPRSLLPGTRANRATLTLDTSPLTGRDTNQKAPYAKVTAHRPSTPAPTQ